MTTIYGPIPFVKLVQKC